MNNTKSNERSAEPMKHLSQRAQQQLQPKRFGVYSRARPQEKK